jgi:hypothetical protein
MPVDYGSVKDVATVTITSEAAIVAAVSTKRFVVRKASLEVSAAGLLTFKDGLAGSTIATVYMAATTRTTLGDETWGPNGKRLTKGNALTATLSVAGSINGQVISDDETE